MKNAEEPIPTTVSEDIILIKEEKRSYRANYTFLCLYALFASMGMF